ncbi:hypothetical protein GCM10023212_12820 [Luteolibacter yonseiensis]
MQEVNIPAVLGKYAHGRQNVLSSDEAWPAFIAITPGLEDLTETERADLAAALSENFGEALWNLAKHDNAAGGEAFAGIQLLSHAQLTAKVDSLRKITPPAAFDKLHTIPPPPQGFIGRVDELEELRNHAGQGGAVISGLKGMGGIGKTALALVLAREWAARFPDAGLLVDGQGLKRDAAPTGAALLAQIILSFHPETGNLPEDEASLRGLYLNVLHGKKALILLDNARDAAQARALLPPDGCALIVTSRANFMVDGCSPYAVGKLKDAEASDLLRNAYPELGEVEVAELVRLCAGLPLALRLAAAHLKLDAGDRGGVADVAAYLKKLGRGRLAYLDAGATDAGEITISETLSLSVDFLTGYQQAAWKNLSIFSVDFDVLAAQKIVGASEEMLASFLRRSLLEPVGTDRYKLHDLAAAYARSCLNGEELDNLTIAHARHYTEVGKDAERWYLEKGNMLTGLALFDRERAQIEAAWIALDMRRDEATAELMMDLVHSISYCSNVRFHARQRIVWLESQLRAARRIGHRGEEGAAVGNLGNAYADLGDARKAIEYYEAHFEIARETENRCAEANALGNLGTAYKNLGDARKAIVYHEQSLLLFREIGDRRAEGRSLGNLGNAYRNLGDIWKALEYYEGRLTIAREVGDRREEGGALGCLGAAHSTLDDERTAIEYHEEHLVIAREIGDKNGQGAALGNLGLAYIKLGEIQKSIGYCEDYLIIAREIGDRHGEGCALGKLGLAHARLGASSIAIEYYDEHLVISREIGDRIGEGGALWNSANEFYKMGERKEAVRRAKKALEIYEAIEAPETAQMCKVLANWK